MGRALDNPWGLLAMLLVLAVVAAVVVIVVLLNRTKAQPPAPVAPGPGYPPSPGGYAQPQGSYYYPGPLPTHPGRTHSSNALIFGIVGLFVLGIVLGPLAISQAAKAERWGVPATAGKVLGWIDLIGGILWLLIIGSWMAAAIAGNAWY